MPLQEELEKFLLEEIRPKLKNDPQLSKVVVWVEELNPEKKSVKLALALGSSSGCSPFCGCAAQEITDKIGKKIKEKFPDVQKIYGSASINPPSGYLEKWTCPE